MVTDHRHGQRPTSSAQAYLSQLTGSPPGSSHGRVRTPVGHRYVEALQASADSDSSNSSSSSGSRRSSRDDDDDHGLDLLVLGVTSGTAMDDIDFALCRFTQSNPEASLLLDIIQYDSVSMPSKIRSDLLSLLREDAAPPSIMAQMDVELGLTFANAVHIFLSRHGLILDNIDLIGSGGQLVTLSGRPAKGQHRSNMCLGEGAVISAKTGITTVSDYRTTEQAVGRQGAPLFSYLVGLLLHHPTEMNVCITIGGITTVCFVPPDNQGGIDAIYDWDTGPGTVLLEAALRFYGLGGDSIDGQNVSVADLPSGNVNEPLLEHLLSQTPYLQTRPPKTTAREIFSDALAHSLISACSSAGCSAADTLATLTRFTSASITQQLLLFGPPFEVLNNSSFVLDGRGSLIPSIISDLKNSFPNARFTGIEAATGVPANAKKAVGFAMQAMEAVLGRAVTVNANADVRRPNSITGKICPGVAWRSVLKKTVGFGGEGRGWEGLPEVRDLKVVSTVKARKREPEQWIA